MITTIRSKLQGLGFRIGMGIMAFIIAAMWVMPPMPQMKQEIIGDWIMDINGNKVSYQEFRRKYMVVDQQLQMFRQQYGPQADLLLQSRGISSDPQAMVLDEITNEALLNSVASKIPLTISPEFVKEKLKDPMFLRNSGISQLLPPEILGKDGAIDKTVLNYYLKRIGMSASQFEQALESALERAVVSELIAISTHVPSFQLQDLLNHRYARKSFSILKWSLNDMLNKEKRAPLTDEELQQFYTEQTTQFKRYWVPEKRAGNVWVFNEDTYGVTVSDKDIERYYDRNKSSFIKTPTQMSVRRILLRTSDDVQEEDRFALAKRIEQELKDDPTQFSRLAKEHSDDAATASNGGLMKPFAKGDYGRDFEVAVFMLKNDGDITNIFKSKDGFEIVQRVEKLPAVYKSLSEVETDIRKKLLSEAFKKRFTADVARLGKKPSAEQIKRFAQEHHAVDQHSIQPSSESGSPDVQALFMMRLDEVAPVVDKGKGLLVQLTQVEKKYLPTLDQIKDEVAQDLYASRAYQAMQQEMKLVKTASKQESLSALKDRYGLKLIDTGLIDFSQEEATVKKLQSSGVPIEYFAALEKVGGVFEHSDNDHGYLIRLDQVQPLAEAELKDKVQGIKSGLYKEQIRRTLDAFVASLHGSATIILNNEIISKLKDRAA